MSDILLVGSAGFVGSNIANYLVQHSSSRISSIDSLQGTPHLKNIQQALQSKNRHSFYLAKAEDTHIRNKIFEIEKPKVVVYNLASYHLRTVNSENQWQCVAMLQSWVADAIKWGCEKFIILLDHTVLYNKLSIFQKEFVGVCEQYALDASGLTIHTIVPSYVFGPRQGMRDGAVSLFQALGDKQETKLDKKAKDFLYIKDYFRAIKDIIDNDFVSGVYQIIGQESSCFANIFDYLVCKTKYGNCVLLGAGPVKYENNLLSTPKNYTLQEKYKLADALEHTLCWYDVNRWAWEQK